MRICSFLPSGTEILFALGLADTACYSLAAVRNDRVFGLDASSYFSRPGPRIVEGIAAMAEVFAGVTSAVVGKAV